MAHFEWDGETFDVVGDDRWVVGETFAVERWLGVDFTQATIMQQTAATVAVSIKRARPNFRLAEVESWPNAAILGVLAQLRASVEAAAAAVEEETSGEVLSPTPPDGEGSVAAA